MLRRIREWHERNVERRRQEMADLGARRDEYLRELQEAEDEHIREIVRGMIESGEFTRNSPEHS